MNTVPDAKFLFQTPEENQQEIDKNMRMQIDASNRVFKQKARVKALKTAEKININGEPAVMLKEADEIYQWLIKDL